MENIFEFEQRVLGQNEAILDDLSLANLRKYKYSSKDMSPTSKYILVHWWNFVAKFMPGWLAPNVITLIGVSAILFNIFLIHIYCPDLTTEMPTWVYYWAAFSLFFYQTMDNVDGRQARKTGTSSPLGELFDHGIDSLNCTFSGFCCVASIGMGHSVWGYLLMFCTCGAMYFSTWETYYTRTLFLAFLNGPTEGLLITSGVHILSAIKGVAWWQTRCEFLFGFRYNELWTLNAVLCVIFAHAPSCIVNVKNIISERDVTMGEALRKIRPLYWLTGSLLVWGLSPYSIMLKENYILSMTFIIAFTFGRITTMIILSHLCHQSYPTNNILLVAVELGAVLYGLLPYAGISIDFLLPEWLYLKGLLIFSSVYFFFYSKLIIDSLCAYLDIRAFTVPPRQIS